MTDIATGPSQPLQVRRAERFWFARLDRPDKRNALSEELVNEEFAGLLRHGAAREGIAARRQKRAASWQVAVPALPDFT